VLGASSVAAAYHYCFCLQLLLRDVRVEHSVETLALHALEATRVQKRDLPARKEKCTTRLFVSKTFLVCVLSLSWETDRDFIGKRQGKKKKRRKMEDWARFRTSHPCTQYSYQGRSTSDDRTPRDRAASRAGNPRRSGLQSRRDCPTHVAHAMRSASAVYMCIISAPALREAGSNAGIDPACWQQSLSREAWHAYSMMSGAAPRRASYKRNIRTIARTDGAAAHLR
jgi:hypothetical protein